MTFTLSEINDKIYLMWSKSQFCESTVSWKCSYYAFAEPILSNAWQKLFVWNGGRCRYGRLYLTLPKFGSPAIILPAWRFAWQCRCLEELTSNKIREFQYRNAFSRQHAPKSFINLVMDDSSEVPRRPAGHFHITTPPILLFLWFNISMPIILFLMLCDSMTIEQDICDTIRCQTFWRTRN
jgi:hypothetical protein